MVAVKGGVWTNIEDEVLKAAISKYGLNQWARVSSLLARKTPKQCKARWNEYLDPSIRKIEWSKDEDEKLLHLAKLMPTQWRTIAPIVGRTANQCLERYQRLLDDAEQREASELGLRGPDGGETQAPSADNVRRLRPGEVDPDPESKPARPDTIDLDEDEKEMLSEARARLANTQGKKAKRKARERQQEEARRLANLQKRRELKTAGINIKVVTRKQGEMDYNADIPFEKKPTMGFYDTSEEIQRNERQRAAFDPRQQNTTNKRKGDEGDDAGRKKRKGDKDGGGGGGGGGGGDQAAHQAAIKAGQQQRLREAEQSSKRRALVLPAPQVSEGELEEIVKMGAIGERANLLASESENNATRGLLQNYSTIQTGAPIRTPRAAPEEDRVANEIRNIRALTETQSSLLGGENTPLREGAGSTGFETATPRKQVLATPNPLATPLRSGAAGGVGGGVLATPLRPGQTPLRTPRDGFALNAAGEPMPVRVRNRLAQGLAALPKPKDTEWDLELPEEEQQQQQQQQQQQAADDKAAATGDDRGMAEDAADRDRRERDRREAQELLDRKRRTQVMQRNLPRPSTVDLAVLLESAARLEDPAEALVARETALLVAHDAATYPLPGAGPRPAKGRAAAAAAAAAAAVAAAQQQQQQQQLDVLDDGVLADARLQVLLEAKKAPAPQVVEAAWGSLVHAAEDGTNALLLGLGCYEDDDDDEAEETALLRSAFEAVRDAMLTSAEKGAKLEKRLTVHLGGYKHRAELLRKKMVEAHEALHKAEAARNGFTILARSEEVAVGRRLAALREEVAYVSRREREAQELYRANREELTALSGGGEGVAAHGF